EPTRNPVFRSCDVVPPLLAAIHTIAPIESAVTKYGGAVQPMIKNIRQVSSRVATVIPEIGLEEEPISPVRRDETVTNRKPKATISSAPTRFQRKLSCGATMMAMRSTTIPPSTHFIDRSRSVRGRPCDAVFVVRRSARPAANPPQIT